MNSNTEIKFRPMARDDWERVSAIYRQGIETQNATFETQVPDWEKWDSSHLQSCRIVATHNGLVVGWAALMPISARKVYAGVGEVSVYISKEFRGSGIGTGLLGILIESSENEGFWTLQSGIFPENSASVKLHQRHGFRIIGYREKIGQINGIWRDTLLLERRSKKN
ncbi:MAG TPA: GNAT family N-acetyltransferase [Bacteroidales bacterium]|nr:GNAT family N-acetyltransferase [Bacteroidales bacterium]